MAFPPPPALTLAVMVWPLSPKLTPLALLNTTVPLVMVDAPAAMFGPVWLVTPPPPADRDSVNPFEAEAVVPVMLVSARVGLPWLWSDWAAVVRYAPGACAVVRNAGTPMVTPAELDVPTTMLAPPVVVVANAWEWLL